MLREVKRPEGVSGRKEWIGMVEFLRDVGRVLYELDFVAGLERHDGFLVVGTDARPALAALFVFTAGVHHVDAADSNLEGLLDRLGDGVLVRVFEHLKGILAELGTELAGLFREADEFENFVGLHQFFPPLTRARIASSALVLTMIFL